MFVSLEHPTWCDSIGRAYVNDDFVKYSDQPTTYRSDRSTVRKAYARMQRRNLNLFGSIDVPVRFVKNDPYDNYADMKASVEKEGVLFIFSGGSTPKNLSHTDNCIARAVHDWYGHLGFDVDFTLKGEFMKWYRMIDYYHPSITQLLFAEVVAQVAAVHCSGGFEYDQRDILAPSRWIESVCEYYDKPVPEGTYYHE